MGLDQDRTCRNRTLVLYDSQEEEQFLLALLVSSTRPRAGLGGRGVVATQSTKTEDQDKEKNRRGLRHHMCLFRWRTSKLNTGRHRCHDGDLPRERTKNTARKFQIEPSAADCEVAGRLHCTDSYYTPIGPHLKTFSAPTSTPPKRFDFVMKPSLPVDRASSKK